MQLGVLGPLLVGDGDRSAVPSAPKPRQVLTLLVLEANHIVPVSALKKELWGDEAPPSALTTLQTYILQLRKALSRALRISLRQVAQEVLITQAGGYTFRSRHDDNDLETFERLAREGRAALAAENNELAARLLRQALDLWRGPALVDVHKGRLLEVHVARLEESMLSVTEQRIEAEMRLGRHHDVLTELVALTTQHQLNENLHAQFMLALHRSGRRPQALNVFQHFRARMIDDLGLDPSPQLQALHCAVLAASPTLDGPPSQSRFLFDRIEEVTAR